ncbi:hypothetical protein XBP1_160021 [Xenorhabdus bovienii str. puntauvense]|uniref:Uncharacterized protein n=1 Tax=Xenorhabdus bovienii str. puntauvense TaxID=1398201 RepID=A0A077N152_XENBV|nr:hypothetical protein [Xenorhabdus bovienii]CDG95811.1 hypothetical protein XBP1_160021 [Xenorhabdus bovienii str. puntauvense]
MSNNNEVTMGIDELHENGKALNIVAKALGYSKEQFIEELRKAQSEGLQFIKFEAEDDSDNDSMAGLMKHSKEQLIEYYAVGTSLPANEYYQLTGIEVAQMAYELLEARETLASYASLKPFGYFYQDSAGLIGKVPDEYKNDDAVFSLYRHPNK